MPAGGGYKLYYECTVRGAPIPYLAYEYISIARSNIGRSRKNGGTETHVQKEQAWNGFYLTADVT